MRKTKFLSFIVLLVSLATLFAVNIFAASKVTATLSFTTATYSGSAQKPSVTVTDSKGKKLKSGTDYTVSYASGRKDVGQYKVTVTLKGKYEGKISKTFKIVPKSTSISSLTAGNTTITAKVKEQKTQTSGYQLQYSTSSSFSSAKTKNSSGTSIAVSSLRLNTKYYARVRTYKTVKGEKFYSSWSGSKNVTTTLPTYKSSAYVKINSNKHQFASGDIVKKSYEKYSSLDSLKRCGVAKACIGKDIMPTSKREGIGQVKPTGWHTVKYDFISGKYLYNRCHLIAFELAGENANEKNLITGTRYMNVSGMLPFENMVHDYVKETGNHVMYRVTPIFVGKELVARGVQIEAYSVEDKGDGINFNVYCFNVQPGVKINYADGSSSATGSTATTTKPASTTKPTTTKPTTTKPTTTKPSTTAPSSKVTYVLNTSTKKFHYPGCSSINRMNASNRRDVSWNRATCVSNGYDPCGNCKP